MCESSNCSEEMASFEVLDNHNMESSDFSLISEQPLATDETLVNGSFNVGSVQSAFRSATQDLSLEEIQEHVLELVKDNTAMKEALTWNNVMMKEQLSTISAWHNKMTTTMSKQQLSLKEAHEKVEELEKENTNLNKELKLLRSLHQIAMNNETSATFDHLKGIAESKESSFKMQPKEYEILKSRCNSLEEEMEKRKKTIHELNVKVNQLENSLKAEQNALEAESIRHAETKKILNEILPAHERMKKLIQVQSKDQKEKDQDVENEREMESKRYLAQIDNLTAQLFTLEEQLLMRDEIVKELTTQVSVMKEDCESVPIFKEQVELYKSELKNLQSTASACSNCEAGSSRGRGRKKSDDASCKGRRKGHQPDFKLPEGADSAKEIDEETFVNLQVYYCPVCQKSFFTVETCTDHVNQCIDNPQVEDNNTSTS